MEIDFAALSPSMSRERLQDSHGAAMIRLAKKSIEQSSDMLNMLVESAATSVPQASADGLGESVDIKL